MKVLTVVGARPQFVKAAPLCTALREAGCQEILVNTGQHYDENMSSVFFEDLAIPPPAFNLQVGSGTHGEQTGAMLAALERTMLGEKPDWVVIYGDTNSTLAGALAAAKLRIRLAHIEAGLRSFNRNMPEEINRVVADHLSDLLLCPSETAVSNLAAEGITKGVFLVGDVMADVLRQAVQRAQTRSTILDRLHLRPGEFLLATIHRAENTDEKARLQGIMRALLDSDATIVFPVHPRTKKALASLDESLSLNKLPERVRILDPVGYLDMVMLESSARCVLTDSGGVQKETYWLGVPCITLRNETEWVETVQLGWNRVVGTEPAAILEAIRSTRSPASRPTLYGDGFAAGRCVERLLAYPKPGAENGQTGSDIRFRR